MDQATIIAKLKKSAGVSAVDRLIDTYKFTTETRDGQGSRDVEVQVWDRGPGTPADCRYYCVAEAADGGSATTNAEQSIELAIDTFHWEHLDQ